MKGGGNSPKSILGLGNNEKNSCYFFNRLFCSAGGFFQASRFFKMRNGKIPEPLHTIFGIAFLFFSLGMFVLILRWIFKRGLADFVDSYGIELLEWTDMIEILSFAILFDTL